MADVPAFELEDGIEVPGRTCGKGRRSGYPWRQMGIGQSFVVTLDRSNQATIQDLQNAIANSGRHILGKGAVVTRILPDLSGIRAWRVA